MTRTVSVLGTGIMGAGMARNLVRAGFEVTVWNRTPERAWPLAEVGARVVADPKAAVAGADAVLTMLFGAESVEEVMREALPAAAPDLVWAQTSTVGLAGTERLAELARAHGVLFVDAPVLGTRQPAEEGKLTILAGGAERAREPLTGVFDAIGARTVWVGEHPGDGHRLKLVANSWVLSVVAGTAQAVSLAQGLGVDPEQFLGGIAGGPLDCTYTQVKGRAMIAREFTPSFTVDGAVKDSALIAEAMRAAGIDDSVMAAMNGRFAAAAADGHDAEDMAAVWHAFTRAGLSG